ncbi:hypothetical protein OYT1_ch0528 [Ferriphaselus amnicola]|uniref:Uncharacterized protein n=1 Tax=Ferriphaselus amnicola TaxID=1188319 RepID=A0A2Z6G9B8_9PROT|nr:hypothetical protein OYT1_ch0528 [Ferriphaselus amnicola]
MVCNFFLFGLAWALSPQSGYVYMFDNVGKILAVLLCVDYYSSRIRGVNYMFGPISMSNPPLWMQVWSDILAGALLIGFAYALF